MRLPTTLVCATCFLAAGLQARIDRVGIPAVIRPGETFNATFEVPIEQPRDYAMLWGITIYDNTTAPGYLPQRGVLGTLLASREFADIADGKWQEFLPLQVDAQSPSGQAVVQMISTRTFGVNNYALVSGWWWNVSIGATTSEELVWAKSDVDWKLFQTL